MRRSLAACGPNRSGDTPADKIPPEEQLPSEEETPSDEEKGSALKYEEVEDGYAVVGFEEGCTDTTLVIPSKHDGKPVTEIGKQAFSLNETMEKVVLPDTLKRISDYAFYSCSALSSLTLPESMQIVGYSAFCGCTALIEGV